MSRASLFAALTLILAACVDDISAATILSTPGGLTPGEQFRFVFVTSGTTNATSTSISTYDTFVTSAATAADLQYDGSPISWQVIGSTSGVTAISRLPNSSPAIYRLDGTKVADSGTDLWDGSLDAAINITELFAAPASANTWTGTQFTGGASGASLGASPNVGYGLSSSTSTTWVNFSTANASSGFHLYAASEVLTVPYATPVPEPGTLTLSVVAVGAAIVVQRSRRRRQTVV